MQFGISANRIFWLDFGPANPSVLVNNRHIPIFPA
jgi:hypothetical protein